MRKIITAAVTAVTLAIFTSCSAVGLKNGTSPNGLDETFSAEVEITLDEMTAQGKLCRYGNDMWDIEFSSPNTISGVLLSFEGGNAEASYKGLSFSVPQSALPIKSMMSNLISAADTLAKSEQLEGNEKDGNLEINGRLESGDYTLTVDKSGNIMRFEMPNNKLTMNFSEVTEISVPETAESTVPAETTVSASQTTSQPQ